MAGPASPSAEGPSYEPPSLPAGWIAQWDSASRKYYYVQLSTGVSQWETPTKAAPGGTPATNTEHPFGVPGQQEVITHPDGSQTVKHPDGRLEPVLPVEASRGLDATTRDRGLGSMAMNALAGQIGKQHGNSHGSSSSPLGGVAGQLLGGLSGSHGSPHNGSSNGSTGSSNPGGKIVGALASNLFSSGHKPDQPQTYHGGQTSQPPHSGGFMGGMTNMFSGSHGQSAQNYGYSSSGQSGGYSGQAPPISYQPPNGTNSSAPYVQHSQPHGPGAPSYAGPSSHHSAASYSPSSGQGYQTPSYGAGAPQPQGQGYGHNAAPQAPHAYGAPAQQHQPYGASTQQYQPPPSTFNGPYGSQAGPVQQYNGQPAYSSGNGAAPVYPHQAQHGPPGGYPGNW